MSYLAIGAIGVTATAAAVYLYVKSKKCSPKSVKLTYFPIQAAAEPTRLALVMTGTSFDDERIGFPEWKNRKASSRYGQMPILTVDGAEYYQSAAMMRWVGAHLGDGSLYPVGDVWKMYDVDEMLGLCDDLARAWQPALYMGMRPQTYGYPEDWDPEEKKKKVKMMRENFVSDPEMLAKFMGFFSERLKATPFLCGSAPTIADLRLLPQLRYFQKGAADFVPTTCLDAYPHVTAWIARMMALPQIKEWYAVEGH